MMLIDYGMVVCVCVVCLACMRMCVEEPSIRNL